MHDIPSGEELWISSASQECRNFSHREEWAQSCYRGLDEFTRHENAQAVSDLTSALALGAAPAGRFEQSDLIQIHLYRGMAYRRLDESRKALEDFRLGYRNCARRRTGLGKPGVGILEVAAICGGRSGLSAGASE